MSVSQDVFPDELPLQQMFNVPYFGVRFPSQSIAAFTILPQTLRKCAIGTFKIRYFRHHMELTTEKGTKRVACIKFTPGIFMTKNVLTAVIESEW